MALASPRLLGLAACRELPSYQGLEMSLAVHHVLGGPIDEQSLRSYANRSEATLEGCEWLAGVAAAGLPQSGTRPGKPGRDAPLPIPSLQMRVAVSDTAQKWYLLQPASTFGALLRDVHLHVRTRVHYEGEEGAERMVRKSLPSGQVSHYKGEKGAERVVRIELPNDGAVLHYEGEKGAERKVRLERPGAMVWHYEGEKGAERMVRIERPSGTVSHYEGEKGAERKVRMRPSEYPAARWLTTRATRAWFVATELGVALRHRRRIAPNPI